MSHTELYDCSVSEIPLAEIRSSSQSGVVCPACASPHTRARFALGGIDNRIWECSNCGLGWMHPYPTSEQVTGFYPPQYYGSDGAKFRRWIERAIRIVGARRLRFLTSRLPRGAAVLDVGCGRGMLLRELADRGYRVFGTERSPEAAVGADPRAEIRFGETLAAAAFDAGQFDQVIVWHVFEHLSDPHETLREIHRLLKEGGTAIIAVPNYSSWQAKWSGSAWFHLDAPRHLYHFSTPALERMLHDTGFTIRSWHHFSLRQNPFGWVQSLLNRWSSDTRNGLYSWLLRHERAPGEVVSGWQKAKYVLTFTLGMPVATALEILAAACRRGATVHVVATKRTSPTP